MMSWKLKDGKEALCNIEDAPDHLKMRSEKYTAVQVELKRNYVGTIERELWWRLIMSGKIAINIYTD